MNNALENNPKAKHLVKFTEVENTPFTIAEQEEQYHILLGKFRMNKEPFDNFDEALKEAETINWDKIINVIGIMFGELPKLEELLTEENQENND